MLVPSSSAARPHYPVVDGPVPALAGSPSPAWDRRGSHGFIPARAGPPARPRAQPGWARVHPGQRGADSAYGNSKASLKGSSPRARGRPSGTPAGALRVGFIPARAGPTVALPPSSGSSSRAGPPCCRVWLRADSGSSPRAGLLLVAIEPRSASIGSSPRARGPRSLVVRAARPAGSSPRSRGRHGASDELGR